MNIANRGFKLDKRMSLVVGVDRGTFASSTKVGVRADSTLVPVAIDPRTTGLIRTQGSIAVNSKVLDSVGSQNRTRYRQRVIDGDETVAMVIKWCSGNAL